MAANLPKPPYYAVIFPNQRTVVDGKAYDDTAYGEMAGRMAELSMQQPGCLGFDSSRDEQGFGITVSYWKTLEDIQNWRDQPEHIAAQSLGRDKWYDSYAVRIAKVERAYDFKK